ncbi:MAG TPA: class I fructose-bisphosphate aldolase [Candidatus Saccharimonadales bacterium]|nr:class I fructose-bisphosphate aldolase [Candidatus Saccharimonadales bacterium]
MQYEDQLKKTAKAMAATGKGLLAADESSGTIAKRFDSVGQENTEETRRSYRQLLLTAPGIEQYLSGVILYDETIRQATDSGQPFAEALKANGIIPGIKVDIGAKDLPFHPGEMVTEGLDGLRERFAEYAELGAGFAKWRAVITIIGDDKPSDACLTANAHALARYAALAQEAGIVPIIEPEVLLDGDHSIERCYEVVGQTLDACFAALKNQGVMLEGTILKTSMVLSGKDASNRADVQTVAAKTVEVLKAHVPENLAGVVFLSGGQEAVEATAHLDAMNKIGGCPWPLTFSYSRAIQEPVLKLWAAGQSDEAVKVYLHRLEANSLASKGQWSESFENA